MNAIRRHHVEPARTAGFTLIEMSIVLVIIGLIVGGVLAGQDLIRAAAIRSQISQIEKYNTAVNTFHGKYGYLPGDINAGAASQFGFAGRGPYAGMGDGNGIIEGTINCTNGTNANYGTAIGVGETEVFWNDLTYASGMNLNLIEGSFNAQSIGTCGSWPALGSPNPAATGSAINLWLPPAKLGGGNYVYVWSRAGVNYFGISAVYSILFWQASSVPTLTVSQACNIDRKTDDGLPQTGKVIAQYVNATVTASWAGVSPGIAAAASSSTCYDNGGNAGNIMNYSLGQNGGAGLNCALSFQFQ